MAPPRVGGTRGELVSSAFDRQVGAISRGSGLDVHCPAHPPQGSKPGECGAERSLKNRPLHPVEGLHRERVYRGGSCLRVSLCLAPCLVSSQRAPDGQG